MWIGLSDETIEEMNKIAKEKEWTEELEECRKCTYRMKSEKDSEVFVNEKEKERIKGRRQGTEEWECKRCGKCCKFIVIPVMEPIDVETESYLDAHGIAYDGKKLIIPAVCQYLDVQNGTPVIYRCQIHNDKFANCRLGGEKECQEAQKAWALLNSE